MVASKNKTAGSVIMVPNLAITLLKLILTLIIFAAKNKVAVTANKKISRMNKGITTTSKNDVSIKPHKPPVTFFAPMNEYNGSIRQ